MNAELLPSGNWRARAYNRYTKKQKSFTSSSKKEALRLARAYANDVSKPNAPMMTFGEAYELYFEANKNGWADSTKDEREKWKTTKYSELLNIPLDELTDEFLQIFVDKLGKTVGPKTVRNIFSPIRSCLLRYRKKVNVCVDMPARKKRKLDLPSQSTVEALLRAVENNEKFCIPVYTATFGCMRRGEIAALGDLIDDHIDFQNCTIFVEFTKSKSGRNWILKEPKNGEVRTIQVPKILLDKIKEKGFPTIDNPNKFSSDFSEFVRDSGIPHLRFHDLRHYCAARMLSLGIPISVVQEYGGWRDTKVLMEIYDYVIKEVRSDSLDKWTRYANRTCQKLDMQIEIAI